MLIAMDKLAVVILIFSSGFLVDGMNKASKWKSWSGNRNFYLVRNANLDISGCETFCEHSENSSVAIFWDTLNPWFEESGVLQRGKRYWVQKIEEPPLHGKSCHYLSASVYPRGLKCPGKLVKQDECNRKRETVYKRLVLKSSPCWKRYGCICQRRI